MFSLSLVIGPRSSPSPLGEGRGEGQPAGGAIVGCYTEFEVIRMKFTAVFEKVPEGYVAFVEELPGANAQGKTLDEARENLQEAVELVIDANRAWL